MTRLFGAATASLFVAAGLLVSAHTPATAGQAVNAKTIAERLDKSKYTTSEIKTYVKGLKGADVTAEGKIDDIMNQPRRTAKVVVLIDVPGRSGKFIVDVHMPQNEADKLRKNDMVICKGEFRRYNPWTLGGIVLEGACRK